MSGSERSSNVASSTRVIDANGHRVKHHHSRDPPPQTRDRDDTQATLRTARRPSFAGQTTSIRHQLGTNRDQDASGRQNSRATYTPSRRDSLMQSSSPVPVSSPAVQVTYDQAPSRHELSSSMPWTAVEPEEQNKPEFRITTILEQRHASQQFTFESNLSELSGEFVAIGANDYKDCYSFIKKNPAILGEDVRDFLKDALNALAAGKEAHANCCIARAVMIRECTESSQSEIKSFFDGLINKKKEVLGSFLKDRQDALANLRAQLSAINERPTAQNTSLQGGMGSLSLQGAPGAERRHVMTSDGDGPTVVGPDSGLLTLEADFQLRRDSAKFFTVGRVFATAWHQSLGAGQGNHAPNEWITNDRFNEPVLTHIQRMAVVKEGHGFCWCVPINSYNRKGVAKKGLSDSDRAAHAVIYMEGTQPTMSDAENNMMDKRSIAVKAAGLDRKLDAMSRINFGKVHTIEHNVKVKNVGNIRGESLKDFERYWNSTMKEKSRAGER